ncbi:DUF302 domain-containing protein [Acidisoma cellulosilytica]|uniref:DUF302 domain-containing protein n=1 Tax=Acidisoma cellulosilyticum TaxID=2802395 RepID=A0A964E6H1_9PROT|nr:DUF302 domain-containing protein [Acidisoma cellulosilyticum]MCB8883725.1 DUF302 domain-containing protein [Acidisoma cellulosilyticum]
MTSSHLHDLSDDRIAIVYGAPSNPSHQREALSLFEFEATLERLRQAISAHDLWLIHEINPQMLAARADYAMLPARQLLVFHPRYLERLLIADPSAVPEIPLKLIVLSMPDYTVTVRYCTATALLGRYPTLTTLAAELDKVLESLVSEIC